jgi:hypothetical protein
LLFLKIPQTAAAPCLLQPLLLVVVVVVFQKTTTVGFECHLRRHQLDALAALGAGVVWRMKATVGMVGLAPLPQKKCEIVKIVIERDYSAGSRRKTKKNRKTGEFFGAAGLTAGPEPEKNMDCWWY